MSDVKAVVVGIGIFLFVHVLTWFLLNGQFFSEWFKNNNFILALFGIPISYLYIAGTKYCYQGFDGLIWPGRFIGFACGMIIFAIFVLSHSKITIFIPFLVNIPGVVKIFSIIL